MPQPVSKPEYGCSKKFIYVANLPLFRVDTAEAKLKSSVVL